MKHNMKHILKAVLILSIATSLYATSPKKVKSIAKEHTDYPSTITAIASIETDFRKIVGDDGKSHGITQLQIRTIRYLMKKDKTLDRYKSLSDKQLAMLVYTDLNVAVEITSKLINFYIKRYGYFQAISRYNGGTKNYIYYNKVMKKLKKYKKL